ncbi:MAG: hypothetical protein AB7U82_24715 [Blastocatellales bacterium]
MLDNNKHNLLYFAGSSMRELYQRMDNWQNDNQKRFLSISIQKDGDEFCCIALTNPSEVVITSADGQRHAHVDGYGGLLVGTVNFAG